MGIFEPSQVDREHIFQIGVSEKSSTYLDLQVGVPSLNPKEKGEFFNPETEPCKAPRLEGAGRLSFFLLCFLVFGKLLNV